MIPKKNAYPVFEANQVLTKAHLNQLVAYLDEQTRISRTNLFGVGIVCGLELSWNEASATIHISKGCGVTTEGYLANVGMVGDETGTCKPVIILDFSADRFKKYDAPTNPGYSKFHVDCDTSKPQHELWQLIPAAAADYDTATPLDAVFLVDKVVLLYVEVNNEQLKNCSPNSCDDKGREAVLTIRPLLITRANAVKLNVELAGQDTLPNLVDRLGLPDLRMPRLNVPNTDMVEARQIFDAYKTLLLDGSETMFHKIGAALSEAYRVFMPVVDSVAPGYNFIAKMQRLETQFRSIFSIFSLVKIRIPVYYAQYYYDLLSDLIQAYDEFRWKALELMALCCPHEALFPRHLLLGEVLAEQPELRHHFRPSLAIAQADTTAEEVRHLFERIVMMIDKFRVTTRVAEGIRITPTHYGELPLSKKSIPYYYIDEIGETALHQRWNYEKTRIGRAKQNLGYHSPGYAQDDFVKNPLNYDLEPYNFFRIEGHIGRPWTEVLTAIMKSIKTYRLPFDVVVVNADNLAIEDKDNPWKNRCIDNDLDVIHRIWVNEINCLYQQKIPALTQPKTPRGLPALKEIVKAPTPVTDTPSATLPPGITINPVGTVRPRTTQPLVAGTILPIKASLLPSNSPIFSGINVNSNLIGGAILNKVGKEEVNTVDKLKNEVNRELASNAEYSGLPLKEFKVVAEHKVNVVADMIAITEELSKPATSLDYAQIDDKFTLLDNSILAYLGDLAIYNPNDKDATMTEAEVQALIKELQALQSNCLRNRLKELKKEVDAKHKVIDELIWFSRFAGNHPDLQHKAGVSVGGTFVLVFREIPENRVVNPVGRPFLGYDIPEGKVLADFFVPNRCCSDCPPVKFVLPPSRPVFSVTLGCPDENDVVFVTIEVTHGVAPFEIKVDGGAYELFNGGIELIPGVHTLVIRDSEGGESLAKKVTTGQRMTVSAVKFDCDAANAFFVARLRIVHGQPPFKLDDAEVAHTEGTGADVGAFFIETPLLASGQLVTITVGDASGCPPVSLEINHTCSVINLVPDVGTTDVTSPFTLDVLKNDSGASLVLVSAKLKNAAMGTVVFNANGGLTYTPSAAAAGQEVVIDYEVKDGNGNTAKSAVTVAVTKKACDLPGDGKALSSLYRLWVQPATDDAQYKKIEVNFKRLAINENLDLTAIMPPFPTDVAQYSPDKFHATMKEWVEKLNQAVQSKVPAAQQNWWKISYETNRNNYAMLRIEYFTAFDFNMSVEGNFLLNKTQTDFSTTLTPKIGTDSAETRLNLTTKFQLPPFNLIDFDKCNDHDTEKARCRDEAPKVSIEIKSITLIRGQLVVSLEGINLSGDVSKWFWDMGQGVSDKPNDRLALASFKPNQGNLQTVRLFGFTKKGCFSMATKVIDLDGNDRPFDPIFPRTGTPGDTIIGR
ncbi:Ig-like domain-containing protein [Haliscomenobacter hydrossis]|uniref:Uncharacterized protein n=1 Tax=Haliscomenobacter hydrossis (strain ATCC 27775 / DSM 1100 / LMG 10767 / O) TaxID=760192 RepID=F4L0G6_HALH1|nr:cadherin-like domain-containing protein [Haliscomenobacter hydrossis]AEE48478.1 hypothetical protein Halhy_0569 [Haliscomenobacter hydrossis DSM 1100]